MYCHICARACGYHCALAVQTPFKYYDLVHMLCGVVSSLWLALCIGNFGMPNPCTCCLGYCRICALASGYHYALAVQHLSHVTLWSICSVVWCLNPLVGTSHWQFSARTLIDVLSYLCSSLWLYHYALAVQHLPCGECMHQFSFDMRHLLVCAVMLWS